MMKATITYLDADGSRSVKVLHGEKILRSWHVTHLSVQAGKPGPVPHVLTQVHVFECANPISVEIADEDEPDSGRISVTFGRTPSKAEFKRAYEEATFHGVRVDDDRFVPIDPTSPEARRAAATLSSCLSAFEDDEAETR